VTKNAPNVFPNVQTPQSSGIDIEALARQYEQKAAVRKMDALMVFASFTMPRESLIRLVRQTGRVGGAVVFNGFKDNSLKATAAAIQELGEGSAHVQINPKAFTKYRVRAVPAVVLTKAEATDQVGEDGCALPNNYAAVSGDVSLDYALDEIAKRDPQFRRLAMRYARQVRGR
jgi:conjugal transfer pilus assembly protein TrbC